MAPDSSVARTGDLTAALAAEMTKLGLADLSEGDRAQLTKLVVDHLGCGYRGATLPWGLAMRGWAAPYAGAGSAVLYANGTRVPPPVAALVNGAAAHGLELDDTHDRSVSHPGAVVQAAAFAVAEACGSSGAEVLAAITAGYEVMGRVGAATGANTVIERGFHPTCLFGSFGAATAAAKLMGLDAERLQRAWGLALSLAGGSMQFSQDAQGTTVKRLHGGYAAQHGVLAAELAERGIDGPAQAFDGTYGLLNMVGEAPQPDRLLPPADGVRAIHAISFKPYPCCRLFHSTLDALAEVSDGFALAMEDVAEIDVGGPAILVTQHMLRRPTSVMAAQYALPFTLATAFVHGPHSVDGFSEAAQGDARILALADKVVSHRDGEMEAAFPDHFGSTVTLTATDGTVREARVLDSLGTPGNPLSLDALIEKFDGLVGPTGAGIDGAETARQAAALAGAQSVDALIAPFGTQT
jgi:2-methylcitrate dehydratase PrpD